MDSNLAIFANNIGRVFQTAYGEISALSECNLKLGYGQFISVLGPSGCGKSTLLALLGVLDQPTSGDLIIAGEMINTASRDQIALMRRQYIGYLFQGAGLIDRMSVLDNVLLPLMYRATSNPRHYALEALEQVGLGHRLHASSQSLSGGERQRVGLARILAVKPRIIICDEPTASLDEENSRMVVRYLQNRADEGALVLCASHDPVVLEHSQERICLSHGTITQAPAPAS